MRLKKICSLLTLFWCTINHHYAQTLESTVIGIHHVNLTVSNLDSSLKFYQKTIGLEVKGRSTIQEPSKLEEKSGFSFNPSEIAELQGPNGRLELHQYKETSPYTKNKMLVQGPGITHVCYQSPVDHSIYDLSRDAGMHIISRGNTPVNRGYGIHYAYIHDPDGIMFEVEQFEKPKFTEDIWLGHVAIATHDIDRLIAFYTELLGVVPYNRIDNIKNSVKLDDIANIDSLRLSGTWFKVGNMVLEMWEFENPPTIAHSEPVNLYEIGYQQIVFEVSDITKEYQRLTGLGANFLSAPIQAIGEIATYFRDPDGNLIRLCQFEEGSPKSVKQLKQLE